MRKIFINTVLLFILIALPTLPSYLQLLNKISNPPLITCTPNGSKIKMYTLKGRFYDLENILTTSLNNKSDNNKTPIPTILERALNIFMCILPSKISLFITPFSINKKIYSKNYKLGPIYICPFSPPPEFPLNYFL